MKRIFAAITLIIMLFGVLSMTSCGKNDGTPNGMQLIKGGEDVGYRFWGPEEWIVSNYAGIACAYVAKGDMSSITFTEAKMPETTIEEYFESEKGKFAYDIAVKVNGDDYLFGNAEKLAKQYVYSYEYKGFTYTCMQIFVIHQGRFYIFTYTANNGELLGENKYDKYLEKVTEVTEVFEFIDKVETSTPETDYTTDSDGYILISDKLIAGFNMYVPSSFKVDYSSALVSATHEDGTNFSMAQPTITGVVSESYWEVRKNNINAIANNSLVEIETGKQLNLQGIKWALAYEYTYVFEGTLYHVYQVQIVTSYTKGYVFTYTATEENYQKHFTEMENVLEKFEY